MKNKNPFLVILQKRKNMSMRMVKMLEEIREKGRVHWTEITTYNDGRTIDALMRRNLVSRDLLNNEWYVASNFSDEEVLKHADTWEKVWRKKK